MTLKHSGAPKAVRRRGSSLTEKVARLARELNEAVEQQTATSDVLWVISSSLGDLEPVFAAMLEKAVRICDAKFGAVYRCDGEALRFVTMHNAPPALAALGSHVPFRPSPKHYLGRMMTSKTVVQVADITAEQGYIERRPEYVAAVELGGVRTYVAAPMLKHNELIGVFLMARQEVRPFTDKQIELVKNFAAQAVIAIENTRLLSELRQRTDALTERTAELTESLEQQTATSEVLRVISSSPGDLQPVFEAILENATRICEAKFANLWLREGDKFRIVATYGGLPEYREYLFAEPLVVPEAQSAMGRIASNREVVQIDDISKAPTYGMRMRIATIKIAKARTLVGVPMLKDNEVVGIIAIYRQEVRPFTQKQIALLTNFAAQAVIAIENARLLTELRESLEQQTATSEVLRVISSSPGELSPVFRAMLENATRICEAKFGNLFLHDQGTFRAVAWHGEPTYVENWSRQSSIVISDEPRIPLARLAKTKRTVHVADLRAEPAYKAGSSAPLVSLVDSGGARTLLNVPMLKEHTLVGAIAIYRQEVRPFTDKQIELVQNFAAQAVIAIENARLLNELRESLEQQTATADVLKIISRSTFDLPTVLSTLVESAARLCKADKAQILVPSETVHSFYSAASYGHTPEYNEHLRNITFAPGREGVVGRVLLEHKPVQIADVLADPDYRLREIQRLGGFRTHLGLPLLREADLIGILLVSRDTVQPFDDQHIELLTTFADQAVIAIENARLLSELRESLEQQTATSEVLHVVSASPSELEPVFNAMLANATRICEAKFGILWLCEGDGFRCVALHNAPHAFAEQYRREPVIHPMPGTGLHRLFETRQVAHVTDMTKIQPYIERDPFVVASVELGGYRSVVNVPMLKENTLVGAISIYRQEVRPFSDKQIGLVSNFAAQAVIAIENARLLNELRQRTTDLTEALEQQTATSDVLQIISSSPGDLQPVFETMLEKAVRICDAKFGNIFRWDGEALHLVATHNIPPAFAEFRRRSPFRPGAKNPIGRMLATKTVVHVANLAAEQPYLEQRDPAAVAAVELGGVRTFVAVPMLKENELIGALVVFRQEVRPFTEKQIELVKNFAAQAVIAIENTRLLNELRHSTTDLTESLEQQTATSEVLSVISRSPGELEPVFETMLANATRLCEAPFGGLFLRDAGVLRLVASHVPPSAPAVIFHRGSVLVLSDNPTHPLARMVDSKEVTHIVDMRTDQSYIERNARIVAFVESVGARTVLCVPMLKDNEYVGAFIIFRQQLRPFTDKQIALVQNFASQAVIAIENTRLLNELRESIGAADGHLGSAAGHFQLARRSRAGICQHAGECRPHL